MNPKEQFLRTWLQDPANRERAISAGFNIDKYITPQQGTGYAGADTYADNLKRMILANEGNPELQNSLYSQYLDYTNPVARQQANQEYQNNMYQIASDMASSDVPEAQQAGIKMLREMYPKYMNNNLTDNYFGQRRNAYSEALTSLGKLGNARPEELQINQILSQAPDNVISAYEAPITWADRISAFNRGEDIFAKLANMFQGNEIQQERLRQLGY